MRPKHFEHEGRMVTAPQLAAELGVHRETVRRRLRAGRDLATRKRSGPVPRVRYQWRGEMLTLREIATIEGLSLSGARRRVEGKRRTAEKGVRGEFFNDKKRYEDDLRAVIAVDIAIDRGGLHLREIGELYGIGREGMRKWLVEIFSKIRAIPGGASVLRQLLRDADSQRAEAHAGLWDQLEDSACGDLGLYEWNRRTSLVDLAKRCGHTDLKPQYMLRSAKRGRDASARRAGGMK